jgi:hypothetical protein
LFNHHHHHHHDHHQSVSALKSIKGQWRTSAPKEVRVVP